MLDARDAWLAGGGRLMYLGGNGFYWVTGVAEDAPDVIEIRRYDGTRCWDGRPGEETLSVTGERGGLWKSRGRGPHVGVGIGFAGQGFDRGAPYRRTAAELAPAMGLGVRRRRRRGVRRRPGTGARPWRGRLRGRQGRPGGGHARGRGRARLVRPHTDAYQGAIETMIQVHPWTGGSHQKRSGVRADMTFMAGPAGGAVFSVGSITWCSTLSAGDYDSDTARITRNVLDAFLGETLPRDGYEAQSNSPGRSVTSSMTERSSKAPSASRLSSSIAPCFPIS